MAQQRRVLVGTHRDRVQLSVKILTEIDAEVTKLAEAQHKPKRDVVSDALAYYTNRMHEIGVF